MGYYEPANRAITTWRARWIFLSVTRQIAPEVLEDLRDLPFESYRSALVRNRWTPNEDLNFRLWAVFDSEHSRCSPSVLHLRYDLLQWAEEYNLEDRWCLEIAFRTVEQWYLNPAFAARLMWARSAVGYNPPVKEEEGRFNFVFPVWDTVAQERGDYYAEAEKAFRQYLVEYCDRLESLTRERGFIEQKMKREHAHFEWLVWYQVKYKSQSWIGDRFNATRSTVAEGIKDAASMCGLTLRPPKVAGRPRKLNK